MEERCGRLVRVHWGNRCIVTLLCTPCNARRDASRLEGREEKEEKGERGFRGGGAWPFVVPASGISCIGDTCAWYATMHSFNTRSTQSHMPILDGGEERSSINDLESRGSLRPCR